MHRGAVRVEREADVGGSGKRRVERAGDDGRAAGRQAPQSVEHEPRSRRRRVFVELVDDQHRGPRDRAQGGAEQQPVGGAQVAHLAVRVEFQTQRLEHAPEAGAPPVASVQSELGHDLVAHAERLVEVVDPAELAEADLAADGAGVAAGVQARDGERARPARMRAARVSSRAVLPEPAVQ